MYTIQWCDTWGNWNPIYTASYTVKRWSFLWTATRYIGRRVVHLGYAKQWRIMDGSRVVMEVERK